LDELFSATAKLPIKKSAEAFNRSIDSLHTTLRLDDPEFTIRYLTYITRVQDPVSVFISLLASCEAANTSQLVTGVNIVAPEDNPVSMRDYWLHMQMFAWCKKLYPAVKYTMHAGELTEGLVQPEELTWHISSAVYDAGAKRIGHGVDIAYEKNCYDLLRYMKENKVDVEINLSSNEFILGVAYDRHPLLLYKQFDVPITISTDDPGISRTSLTEQYVLLAKRYKEVSYQDIKKYVYNSITYSFIKEPGVKQDLIKRLDAQFLKFEMYILEKKPKGVF
jgi:adenosine deaminase